MRATPVIILVCCGLLGTAGAVSAQSYTAPAGTEPATAPGGDEGIAGRRNESEALRSGDAVPVPPGAGVVIEGPAAPPPDVAEPPPAGRR